ncbi:phosphoglycerate kinase [Mycoplasmoides pirum]|uniref:phosphoglycerate kinase n=1 Tax=Mycoplasmoides pirum TaxID=2122 RepID=UPI0004822399|nr:phosphoglycerate kinase [Mycoplasmoides pirum]
MNYNKKTLDQVDIQGKKVIVRLDLNVPIVDGVITDIERIVAALPTLKYLIEKNCKIICLSHLGRIKSLDDKNSNKKSLKPVSVKLQELLGDLTKVKFLDKNVGDEVIESINQLEPKEILLLENTRYNDVNDSGEVIKAESKNDPKLGLFWASLADVFVNDAFGTAHRAHASNVGIASNIQTSCIGFLIQKELDSLQKVINNPERPLVVVLGGAKVADKLGVIKNLLNIADEILIGGGMTYTFLKAKGMDLANTKYEEDLVEEAKQILASEQSKKLFLPIDLKGSKTFEDIPPIICEDINQPWPEGFMGMDIGEKTIELYSKQLAKAKTIFWNGPVGVFEFSNFSGGTNGIAKVICDLTSKGAYTVIGGGDSASAINNLGLTNNVSFVSTGGGASLSLLEGTVLPGIECIPNK